MSDARRRAEEALARLDRWDAKYRPRTVEIDADDLRSLLAEEDEREEELRRAIEIEREGQRSMARALNEINRLSRLDVAISLAPAPPAADEVREAAENLRRLALQGAIDVPEVLDEINSLLAALARPGAGKEKGQ